MSEQEKPQYEIDALDFLETEFEQVKISACGLGRVACFWRATYAIAYGLNEIAKSNSDEVSLDIVDDGQHLRFKVRTTRADLSDSYTQIVSLAGEGHLDLILNKEVLPTYAAPDDIDHDLNFAVLECLIDGPEYATDTSGVLALTPPGVGPIMAAIETDALMLQSCGPGSSFTTEKDIEIGRIGS